MAVNIDTKRRYYSMRAAGLEDGDYYTTIKNQTFQQNSFFTFSSPRQVLNGLGDDETEVIVTGEFYIPVAVGALTLIAGNETLVDGEWTGVSVNGGSAVTSPESIWRIEDDDNTDITFVAGYNSFVGTFTADTSQTFRVLGFWESTWKA